MKCALITIGDELLSGMTIDSNAAWIGQELQNIGFSLDYHVTIPDDIDRIKNTLAAVATEYQYIVTTGGLGPTHDDTTPTALYEYFNSKLEYDEEYWEYLKKRFNKFGVEIPENNRSQVIIPHNGVMIPNPIGSARGLQFEKDGCMYFSTPGVPGEMKAIMLETILPLLATKSEKNIHVKTIRITGVPESSLAQQLHSTIHSNPNCTFAFYPNFLEVNVRVTCLDKQEMEKAVQDVVDTVGEPVFGFDYDTLELKVGQMVKQKGFTLATAESCTGGLVGHKITSVAGSSDYYLGGVVTYSNAAKRKFLHVKQETLDEYGAVSRETAQEMAEGVRNEFNADIGLSITGVAGPGGGTEDKPVGTVFFGLALPSRTVTKHRQFGNDRDKNKLRSSQFVLNLLRKELNGQ